MPYTCQLTCTSILLDLYLPKFKSCIVQRSPRIFFGLAFLSKPGGKTLVCLRELFQVSLRGHVSGNLSL